MRKLLSGIAAIAVLSAGTSASAQDFTLKISSPTINDLTQEWAEAFKAGVEERSEGRIAVEFYPASQLGQIPATVEGVIMGTVEMTVPAVGFFVGLEPRFQVLDVPGLFDSIEHGQRTLADPEVRALLATFGQDQGVEPLYVFLNGPLMALSHRPITSVEDFTGQRIRLPGASPVQTRPFDALGAAGVSMPLGEVLPAMQNRAIDGAIAAFAIFDAYRYYDVAPEITYLPSQFLMAGALVNRDFMAALGPDLEAIVREEALRAEEIFLARGDEVVEEIEASWENGGGTIHSFDEAEAAEYVEVAQAAALEAIEANAALLDAYEILRDAAERNRQ